MNEKNDTICLGGLGESVYKTGQPYLGDRVYDSRGISVATTAAPVGRSGGFTPLYLVRYERKEQFN